MCCCLWWYNPLEWGAVEAGPCLQGEPPVETTFQMILLDFTEACFFYLYLYKLVGFNCCVAMKIEYLIPALLDLSMWKVKDYTCITFIWAHLIFGFNFFHFQMCYNLIFMFERYDSLDLWAIFQKSAERVWTLSSYMLSDLSFEF